MTEMPRLPALRGFVGRDRELAELTAGLDDALAGLGRLFLLAGEPGIGKTGLTEQLAAQAAARGAVAAWGRCWEGGGAPPFWPWAQIVESVAADCDDDTLRAWLGPGAAAVVGMAPGLAFRLGQDAASPAALPGIASDAARFSLFLSVAAFLKRAAAAQPCVLIFEDLHAADDASLLLLRYLARDLRGTRLFLLGTYRDAEIARLPDVGDAIGALVREGHLTTLHGLPQDDVRDLIAELGGVAPSAATVAAIHETTEGNPLFVREAVRLLASSGALASPERPAVPIPSSVRALIQQRLAPLSVGAVQVLSAAAVVGRDFDVALVGPACELPPSDVLAAVSEAVALGVVAEESVALGRYRFSHSLMREVVYESLPIPVRASLHRAVGEAIERLYGPDSDTHMAELARHFSELTSAGERERALQYTRRAGDLAMRTHAYEDAVAEYGRALRTLDLASPSGADDALRCDLLLSLGAAQVRAGRYPAAKETHLQAAELARQLTDPERFTRAALGYGEPYVEGGLVNRQLVGLLREGLEQLPAEDSPLRARTLARLSVELTFSDEIHLTDGLSRQAVGMARRLGEAQSLGAALDARWMAVWGPDGLSERTALAHEILQLARQTGQRDLELMGRGQRATSALESGDLLAFESEVALHGRLADELRMPVRQWTTTTMRATRALLLGHFSEAEALAEEGLALQPELPNARWAHVNEMAMLAWERGQIGEQRERWQGIVTRFPRAAFARGWLGLADLAAGDRAAAQRTLTLLAEQIPLRPRSGLWLPGFALAAMLAAQLDDAAASAALYTVLAPYAGHVVVMPIEHPVVCFGSTSLHLGTLAHGAGRLDAAAEHFAAALREHERLGAAPLLARTRVAYGRLLLLRERPEDQAQAADLLDRAEEAATALGMPGLRAEIAALRADPRPAAQEVRRDAARPLSAPEMMSAKVLSDVVPRNDSRAPRELASRRIVAPRSGSDGEVAPAQSGGDMAPPPTNPAPPPTSPSPTERFQREGEYWTIAFNGETVRLKDSKGLRQIAVLLGQPGRELPVTELEALVSGPADTGATAAGRAADRGELEARSDTGDAGELLDAEAKAAYKTRLDDLQEEIDEAEAFNDAERAEQARAEREFLIRELARAVGLGGRDRKAASHAERARLNATRAIRSAMANVAREHPLLGQHLAATIRTGRYCSYTPDPRTPVAWSL
ncbi:MAG: AAA family ATPase [Chloroflexi bacterium]|nr:AAA family ATPase [Chloroflexota bacterium]